MTLTADTLTFAAGDTSRTIDETVVVTLSGPANATLGAAMGMGTITDDDATPTVTPTLNLASISEEGGRPAPASRALVRGPWEASPGRLERPAPSLRPSSPDSPVRSPGGAGREAARKGQSVQW